MEQHLFVLLLFTGVLPLILSVRHKYYLIQQGETWNDAQAYCQATYSDLATIESNDDMVQLQSEAQTQQFTSSAWIGLFTNINSWHWAFRNEPLGDFIRWYYPDPNNLAGNDQCGCIKNNKWGDATCSWLITFVCFDDTKTGTDRYIFISTSMTWYAARSYCRQHYTDLASAKNSTENSAIGALNYNNWTWFGLIRDPWKWSDQTTYMPFITWSPGNPDDYLMNKSCGYFSNSRADVAQCSDIMPFYCYLSTQQQIMKVKVMSSQDVNDPAIIAAILEKILQKLKNHGTRKITVKWREQPDGVVFQKEKEIIV